MRGAGRGLGTPTWKHPPQITQLNRLSAVEPLEEGVE